MKLQLHTGDIGNYLKEHNIKPSYQRMKIFQYLLDNHNHPTVDTIYREKIGFCYSYRRK